MDVFALRDRVVNDYARYIDSFVRIRDKQIDKFVDDHFLSGTLWPDAILQLNPAYEAGLTLDKLAARGVLHQDTARFFRKPDGLSVRLYKHQQEAIEIAARKEPYVVTTGTGSGKSLTYFVSIVDQVLRNQPEKAQVRAIIVYPMNALINSQHEALKAYARRAPDLPIRFEQYTSQTKQEARQRILDSPPHILLTNYVMLEYMLLRPAERVFTDRATANLEFLVLDELHTYRGRQGADVAMLLRRLRERAGNPKLIHVGTSATLTTEGTREERRKAVADVATKLFGTSVKPENVVDETLRRAIQVPPPATRGALQAALDSPVPTELAGFRNNSLPAWVEDTFGVAFQEGQLARRKPVTFPEGVRKLSEESGRPEDECDRVLKAVLTTGNSLMNEDGEPVFAFRLHQFFAAGGTVYTTLEPAAQRKPSLEGQYYAPGGDDSKLLYPLVFCRECGQEYYMVNYRRGLGEQITPRAPLLYDDDEDADLEPGYVLLEDQEEGEPLWKEEYRQELPDHWFDRSGRGDRIKRNYQPHLPRAVTVAPDGSVVEEGQARAVKAWFQPKPFLLCLRCGAAYDRTEKNDFRKLTRLSHTGRSTATTLMTASSVVQLRDDDSVSETARKLLSFTDNRQDASLQAGHFNDFIQVALVRSALYKALAERGSLDHASVTRAVFQVLALDQEVYAKQPASHGQGKERNEKAMLQLLEYRLYEDLRRGWRIVQPNLEQCGLLRIDYPGLEHLCRDEDAWSEHPVLKQAPAEKRHEAVRGFLDHLRREMAIDARFLDPEEEWELRQRVQQNIKEPWAFDEHDILRRSTQFVLPGQTGRTVERERSLAPTARVARYLRAKDTWGLAENIAPADWETLARALVKVLRGNFLAQVKTHTKKEAVQLLAAAMEWQLGDGTPPPPDPVRSKWMRSAHLQEVEREANKFFAELYRETARKMSGMEGKAHTGQVPADLRQEREQRFREGKLAVVFCSPTMELGIDIRDLNIVHLRNIPPTPANYAQRSGRAGRSGQPALVMAFCSEGSPHDQYFFRRPDLMVAGAVAPARFELGNEDLVRAHIHSVWLAAAGIALGHSIADILDLEQKGFPLVADAEHRTHLSDEKQKALAEECERILEACGKEVKTAPWYSEAWLPQVLKDAPTRFDRAFDRWRELYAAAVEQRKAARTILDRPRADHRERQKAQRQENEAKREITLLLNQGQDWGDSDFYPYRYLASEGFMPGYNFPRLPLRALIPAGDKTHIIERPRFLAVREFGPRNIIYHEGRKYRLTRCVLPAAGPEGRLLRAKFCKACGYFHDRDTAQADVCDHCGVSLTGDTSRYVPTMFEMTTVRGRRVERITCDEEERTREGYDITTHYRFAAGSDGQPMQQRAQVATKGGEELLQITYAPQASLWRVNQKWRRSTQPGFALDARTGFWAQRPGEDDRAGDVESNQLIPGVLPFVHDTRNLLLLRPEQNTEEFLASLSYALQRGIQVWFQVEEQEIAVGRIGEKEQRAILFWEAAEGGTGIWPRLLEERDAFARVAVEVLRVCHFDPESGEDLADPEACGRACYRCLLSYSNQPDHPLLNRHLLRDFLLELSKAYTYRQQSRRTYEEQYAWLEANRDPNSSLEAEFLKVLYESRRRLPDRAQFRPEQGVYAEADFYYERNNLKGVAVFVDGPTHDEPAQKEKDTRERGRLEDMGYRVIVIRYDGDLRSQVQRHSDVFGPGLN